MTTPPSTPENTEPKTEPDGPGPTKPKPYREEDFDDAIIHDEDDTEKYDHEVWFLTRSRILAYKNAACTLFINTLPDNQRWMFFALFLHTTDVLVQPRFTIIFLAVAVSWYFPALSVVFLAQFLLWIDGYFRTGTDALWNSASRVFDFTTVHALLRAEFGDWRPNLLPLLEPIIGPAEFWPHVLWPMLPGLMFTFQRSSINGFVPESRKQGLILALFSRACMAVVPRFFLWTLFGIFAFPNHDYPVMVVEYLACSIVWQFFDVNPQAAYACYLFVNQWTHWTIRTNINRDGAVPSALLMRERTGTRWFAFTCLAIRVLEVEFGGDIVESGTMDLSVHVWLPLVTILCVCIYLLRYGLGIRLHKFKHQPIKHKDGIRLLRLRPQPRFANSPIQCDIIHVRLGALPSYTAVSHRWAGPGDTQEIILIDEAPFLVSSSIHALLLAKRSNLKHIVLWIDSVCINQEDETEKGRQVAMMRRIFEEATMTLGWLGEDPGADKAFRLLLHKLHGVTSPTELTALRREKDVGWAELEHMLRNPWFERVWIIQEIAASTNAKVRYGRHEMDWRWLAGTLMKILTLSSEGDKELDSICREPGYMNMLIMENIRLQVNDVDFLKLKDMLKLSRRFQATLPVDKVYALLGITDERNAPLFHPDYSRLDSLEDGVSHVGHVFKDLITTIKATTDILGTASGESRTLKGRAMLREGKGMRHMKMLIRDLEISYRRMKRIMKGKPDFELRGIQAVYSDQTTAERVYTVVARDLVRQGDFLSFVSHAGIGISRNVGFKKLPSWVPDWSTDVEAFILPHVNRSRPNPKPWLAVLFKKKREEDGASSSEDEQANENANENDTIVRDGGFQFLHIKASPISKITHVVPLTPHFSTKSVTKRGKHITEARQVWRDFKTIHSNYNIALALALQYCPRSPKFPTSESVTNAFFRTSMANTSKTGQQPVPSDEVRERQRWIQAQINNTSNNLAEDVLHADENGKKAAQRWLMLRRMQSSANARIAQLVLSEIAPSFATYSFANDVGEAREKVVNEALLDEQKEDEEEKRKWQSTSIFRIGKGGNMTNTNPLRAYVGVVDYTIGRRFAIAESGDMGLVPDGTEVGDLLVALEDGKGCLVLRQAVFSSKGLDDDDREDEEEDEEKDDSKSLSGKRQTQEDLDPHKMFRLVGEAYVHGMDCGVREDGDWFVLW